jgi:dsRNA-specific ribonuclease
MSLANEKRAELKEKAWVGDAVLELYIRSMILKKEGRIDAEQKKAFCCNQFLNCFGAPTEIEAKIGEIYQKQGLEAACQWIEETMLPLFEKQQKNKKR